MARWVTLLALVATGLGAGASSVAAHGGAPAVLALLALDDAGAPSALRLNEGLAVSDGEGLAYACPAAFLTDEAPLAQPMPDGSLLVVSRGGHFILDHGEVRQRRPADDTEVGAVLLPGEEGPLLLTLRDGGSVLTRELPEGPVELWSDPEPWSSAVPLGAGAHLAHLRDVVVGSVLIDGDGGELAREAALAPDTTSVALARVAGDRPLVTLLLDGGLATALGRIEAGSFVELSWVRGSILGPATDAEGRSFVVVNGTVRPLDGDTVGEPLGELTALTCIGAIEGRVYVCDPEGALWLSPDGDTTRAFELASLEELAIDGLLEESVDVCALQWQRYLVDLIGAGLAPGSGDAGLAAQDASTDSSAQGDGGEPRDRDAAAATDSGVGTDAADDGGCSCSAPGRRGRGAGAGWLLSLLVSVLVAAQRARSRVRPTSSTART